MEVKVNQGQILNVRFSIVFTRKVKGFWDKLSVRNDNNVNNNSVFWLQYKVNELYETMLEDRS